MYAAGGRLVMATFKSFCEAGNTAQRHLSCAHNLGVSLFQTNKLWLGNVIMHEFLHLFPLVRNQLKRKDPPQAPTKVCYSVTLPQFKCILRRKKS